MSVKIQLSPEESELVQNTQWLLAKHIIIKKVYTLFGELNEVFRKEAEPFHYLFPENFKSQSGKISQGNNYQLLPYVILDYPAFFWKERVLAIRTLFWWGNFFSVTLHLSGMQKNKLTSHSNTLSYLQKHNFYICVNDDEWQHHYEEKNYQPARAITLHQLDGIINKNFIKVSKKLSISEWQASEEFIINAFREILQLLQISYQGDKRDL